MPFSAIAGKKLKLRSITNGRVLTRDRAAEPRFPFWTFKRERLPQGKNCPPVALHGSSTISSRTSWALIKTTLSDRFTWTAATCKLGRPPSLGSPSSAEIYVHAALFHALHRREMTYSVDLEGPLVGGTRFPQRGRLLVCTSPR